LHDDSNYAVKDQNSHADSAEPDKVHRQANLLVIPDSLDSKCIDQSSNQELSKQANLDYSFKINVEYTGSGMSRTQGKIDL
jgi:hypothetical protein